MKAIVNVAVGGNYPLGQRRLRRSLIDIGETAERIFFKRWPDIPHSVVSYGFKVDAFREAHRRGYDRVIWIDSSCWMVKPLEQAWKQIERDGYLLGLEGWTLGQWCSDEVLQMAGYTRRQALDIPLMEGKFIGLDLSSPKGNRFLNRWEHARDQGWFNGAWSDHRHDISAGSIIAHEEGLELTPHLIEFDNRRPPHPEVFVRAAGL